MIEVKVVDGLKLVSGRIEGDLTKEIARRYFEEVGKLAYQNGLNRVFTDLREANLKADEHDMSELSQELAQLGLASSYKRAVVVREDVRGYKQWENHCLSAGFKKMRLFVDDEAALEWLAG
ncbi:hypothetical protein [Roseivirga sp.]|uniref:hypothetical protein n=1 Tax=Roseivirga sp. TaxID=1964215 RepID=UPI003B51E5AF